jgi:hypothetical protein
MWTILIIAVGLSAAVGLAVAGRRGYILHQDLRLLG